MQKRAWWSIVATLALVLTTGAYPVRAGKAAKEAPPIGSPAGTRSLDGKQLPAPELPFGGTIEHEALKSKPWWPRRTVPPAGAPNVLRVDGVACIRT
ncbi:MAG: hypothetical protein OZ922_14270 [Myxococcales bacterium]|jgi:arylsulfatase|nr:hypothetical protein [Myxococcales bacterium]